LRKKISACDQALEAKPTHALWSRCIINTFRRMLKTAVLDSTQEFRLEKEILEARRMNTYVSFLHLQ
jgi:hypothetical protein